MDPASLGLRIGASAVAPLVRKLFRPEGPGAELVERPVRISSLVSFTGEKRTLTPRDLHRLSGELVARAVRGIGPHDALSPAEEHEVAQALAASLTGLGDLRLDDVQAVRLGADALARTLGAASASREKLSSAASALHDRLLRAACEHILHFFTQRSAFVARTLVEQSRQLDRLDADVTALARRTPTPAAEGAAFEGRYAAFLQAEYGQLAIYGLDLRQARSWPLDDAYLSLEARAGHSSAHEPPDAAGPPVVERADRALHDRDRVLLRGAAGSGKTTLVQWLAVSAARGGSGDGLAWLSGRVPFVLPMRTLTRGGRELPAPADFLSALGWPLAGGQPDHWVDRVLTAGRGLLLIDGIDEIPEQEREAARRWLVRLTASYPGNRWLVTARPSAVPPDWLRADGFHELSLAPMGAAEVETFVRRWHLAVGAGQGASGELLDLVRSRPDLGALVTSPLMCALVCALHRERNGHLPHGRKALYDAALTMLLERRDLERPDPPRAGLRLDADTQISLLQKLAYWLITNGRAELDAALAARLIGQALPMIHRGGELGPPERVLRLLLERSGVLREPVPGAVDFVHRTFQDYLGAREMVDWQHFPALVEKAHLDQWEDVIRMAVAHAQPVQRGELLEALVARGDAEPDHRLRLHLLAAACLEHATQLLPRTRDNVLGRAAAALPPRVRQEGITLAGLGTVALELLPGPERLTEDEAYAVVVAATRMGTEAALTFLRAFRDHPSLDIQRQLSYSWHRFDADRYFEEIIRHLPRDGGLMFSVQREAELARLGTLSGLRGVDLRGEFTEAAVLDALAGQPLTHLRLDALPLPSGLALVREFPSLRTLHAVTCPAGTDLSVLAETEIRAFTVTAVDAATPVVGLAALERLEWLALGARLTSLSELPQHAPLSDLNLTREPPDLAALDNWPRVAHLGLAQCERHLTPAECRALARLPQLRSLNCAPLLLRDLQAAQVTLPHVRAATIFWPVVDSAPTAADLDRVADALPGLRSLHLLADPGDFAPLARLPELRTIQVLGPSAGVHVPEGCELIAEPEPRY